MFSDQRPDYAATASSHANPAAATAEVIGHITESLDGPISVAALFVSGHHAKSLPQIVEAIHALAVPDVLIGITSNGVFGGSQRLIDTDAIALWAATGLKARAFHAESPLTGDVSPPQSHISAGERVLLLADPYTFDAHPYLSAANTLRPRPSIVGGFGAAPGGLSSVVVNDEIHSSGAAGVVISPHLSTVLSVTETHQPLPPEKPLFDEILAPFVDGIDRTGGSGDEIIPKPSELERRMLACGSGQSALFLTSITNCQTTAERRARDLDIHLVSEHASGQVAGMVTAGEFGPVGNINAIRSLSANVLMFHHFRGVAD